MNNFFRKIIRKSSKQNTDTYRSARTIEQETNVVFEKYKKSFKDLARYDRGEEISNTN